MSRVMIVDSLPIMRRALRVMLGKQGHEVIAEADNGLDALALCRDQHPDLVVLELAIPRLGGLDVLHRLKASQPALKVLVYSVQDSGLYASRSLQAGADAFVSKLDGLEEFIRALHAVVHGRSYFPREAVHAAEEAGGEGSNELAQLSARELMVLELLAKGLSNQQIAEQLALSYKTVSTYKTRLQQKLHVHSTVELLEVTRHAAAVPWAPVAAASAELPQDYAMLRALVDGSPNPMFIRDREGRLLTCNRHFLEYYHVPFDTVRGTRLDEAPWLAPEFREEVQRRFVAAVEQESSLSHDTAIDIYGSTRVLHVWGIPYRDEQGQVTGMVGGLQDLSKREVLLAELRNAKAEAEAMSRAKSEALAALHRELRAPFEQLATALQDRAEAAPEQAALALIQQALRHAEQLLQLDAERLAPRSAVQRLGELSAAILAPLSARAQAQGAALTLEQAPQAKLMAWIDERHYRQLLELLLSRTLAAVGPAAWQLTLHGQLQPGGLLLVRLDLQGQNATQERVAVAQALDAEGLAEPAGSLQGIYLQHLLQLLNANLVFGTNADAPLWCLEMTLSPAT
ncbi:response regulator [Aquipseudomonas ullengensis]|uniref:Response regulator n=1 Tax=Aquipseudomonas ullengensis TaxID=2759166 RepID=A0A7W4QDP2_9GAMM|nr:response regulator [Pseudomonas ullengensis]MBB2494763.1 response regulator [Pseudomonas ullengensis]